MLKFYKTLETFLVYLVSFVFLHCNYSTQHEGQNIGKSNRAFLESRF